MNHALGSSLYDAVYEEVIDNSRVRSLLGQGADANWQHPEYGSTPLYRAARNGHEEAVRELLEHGAQVDTTNSSGRSPLMTAAFHGHLGVVSLLLRHGADASLRPRKGAWTGLTALDLAMKEGKQDCVMALQAADSASQDGQASLATRDPRLWSSAEVAAWLGANGMEEHVPAFAAGRITGSELCVLSAEDLVAPPICLSPLQARAVVRYRDLLLGGGSLAPRFG